MRYRKIMNVFVVTLVEGSLLWVTPWIIGTYMGGIVYKAISKPKGESSLWWFVGGVMIVHLLITYGSFYVPTWWTWMALTPLGMKVPTPMTVFHIFMGGFCPLLKLVKDEQVARGICAFIIICLFLLWSYFRSFT